MSKEHKGYLFCPGLREEIPINKQLELPKSSSLVRRAIVDPIDNSLNSKQSQGGKKATPASEESYIYLTGKKATVQLQCAFVS